MKSIDDSDSENEEFITIKVTNEEGKIEREEFQEVQKHVEKPR